MNAEILYRDSTGGERTVSIRVRSSDEGPKVAELYASQNPHVGSVVNIRYTDIQTEAL